MDPLDNGLKTIELIKNEFIAVIIKIKETKPEVFADSLFGVWATTALADLLCASAKALGTKKETIFKMIEEGWSLINKGSEILN